MPPDNMPAARALRLESLVEYSDHAVVSRTLLKNRGGTLTVFAFDAGQELSEHSAPFDAYVTILDADNRGIVYGGSDSRTKTQRESDGRYRTYVRFEKLDLEFKDYLLIVRFQATSLKGNREEEVELEIKTRYREYRSNTFLDRILSA